MNGEIGNTKDHTVLNIAPRTLAIYMEDRGFRLKEFCKTWNYSYDSIMDTTQRIPLTLYSRLMLAGRQFLNEPLFHLEFPKPLPFLSLPGVSCLMEVSQNLQSALERWAQYISYINSAIKCVVYWSDDQLFMDWGVTGDYDPAFKSMIAEFGTKYLVEGSYQVMPGSWDPNWVEFSHDPFTDLEAYKKYFSYPIFFGKKINRIVIDKNDAAKPMAFTDKTIERVIESRLVAELQKLNPLKSYDKLIPMIRRYIYTNLEDEHPNLDAIADELGIGVRSLQRHLQKEGTSFSSLVKEVRCDLAKHYLTNPHIEPIEVAFLLGYSDESTFRRSFKACHGKTVGEYRKNINGDDLQAERT